MIKLNHYLRELGINEDSFPFNEPEDPRYSPDEEGFVPAEFFSLDYSLALYIYSHLRYFKDNCLVGYPGCMTFEEWSDTLDKMIKAFELIIKDDDQYPLWDKQSSKRRARQINHGLKLFAKYFRHLWY